MAGRILQGGMHPEGGWISLQETRRLLPLSVQGLDQEGIAEDQLIPGLPKDLGMSGLREVQLPDHILQEVTSDCPLQRADLKGATQEIAGPQG
jgi:hypothetical protein